MQDDNVRAATHLERCLLANLESTGRLLGQFVSYSETTHNVMVSGDYLQLRATILRALQPHPEAARALSAALSGLELDAAREMTTPHGGSQPERPNLITGPSISGPSSETNQPGNKKPQDKSAIDTGPVVDVTYEEVAS